jgi:hypothetical protein
VSRTKSVFQLGRKSLASVAENDLPRRGTKLRACYDYLFENRGRVVELPYPTNMIVQLNDFYGCDIERKWGLPVRVQLRGEWRHDGYLDYRGEVIRN